MKKINLNDNWRMHEAPLKWDKTYLSVVSGLKDGWYTCDLPTDVRMPLLEHEVIKEPLQSDYCRESEWIEDRSWWFEKKFTGKDIDFTDDIVELVLEGLDTRSDIFINGHYLGTHRNVHYPFVYDVKEFLSPDENVVSVRMTSGLEEVSEEDLAELDHAVSLESRNGGKHRGDARRSFVRRPQYTVGWDWGPKVITVGITGNVFLRGYKTIAIRDVQLQTTDVLWGPGGKDARLKAVVNVENLSFIGTRSCDLEISLYREGSLKAQKKLNQQLLTSGYNYIETEITVEDAMLWWPNGYGEQPLYQVEIKGVSGESVDCWPTFRHGIRTLSLDTSIIRGEDRNFRLIVNGQEIYCKGGNWIPNDFIYARVKAEKYHVLTDEAVEANFNMLRIWGGGLYERELFYELCDEKGLLVWQDFMFACSTYPDHHQWFKDEMRYEFDYQTKRLRNHCSMALFCGTNEVHWIFNSIDNPRWQIEFTYEHQYGLWVANILAKEVIYQNCPQIPYWNSSPYGGDLPNSDSVGDVHRWHNALMSKKMEERIEVKDYDTIQSKFVSEYGFIGPCCLETTRKYMGDAPLDRTSEIWQMHSNVFEKGTINEAIRKNYVDHPEKLSMEEYILYGGMVHGLMYGYSLEAMRFKEECGGGLFWMYNDAWGEVGWTIIDYYLKRKIPYYAVKRAFAHKKVTMREVDGQVILQGLNDTPDEVVVNGRFGYVSFDGTLDETRKVSFVLPAHFRGRLHTEKMEKRDYTKGSYMFYAEDSDIDNIWLRMDDNRNMSYDSVKVEVMSSEDEGENQKLTVRADGYIHGVYVKGDMDCSDNYFDLLPGEQKVILVKGAAGMQLEVDAVR